MAQSFLSPKLALIAALMFLTACAERAEVVMVPQVAGASVHEVLFATNRAPNARLFGNTRSATTSYGTARVSVPPAHEKGVVEYPTSTANPKTEFGILSAKTTQSAASFDTVLAQRVAARAKGNRRAVVYVHGYNNTFAEALYMNTQIIHDYQSPDIPVLFSWPSAGDNLGYLQDAGSVMYSRSALEALLDQLNASGVESFVIIGHSIGSQLVMEALRQHAIRNHGQTWSKLDGVLLVSPDIDVDNFEQQRKDMGGLPQPFVVVGSGKDRLLKISGVINGGEARLGTIEDTEVLGNDDATVVSASFATHMLSTNHTTAFTSPAMMALLQGYYQD
jgi:esterase/lipase superfamily enzyme